MGMVLTAMPIGEYDKRLVILTKERGKITAFAKGARRPNSAFLACGQPFSFGEFSLYEGRSAYNLISVDISNYFGELRNNMEACYYGLYFLELADYFTRENEEASRVLKLLYQSLRALTLEVIPVSLIRMIFELKIFEYNGWAPEVFQCGTCGTKENLSFFYTNGGGIFCKECQSRGMGVIHISPSTIYTMQYILSSPIEKLYTFKVSEEVEKELKKCMESYRNAYIDKKLKSLELIEKLFSV